MTESNKTLTINGYKVKAPSGGFIPKNAESLLLAGHLRHILTACETPVKLEISSEDRVMIEKRLSELEDWLQPSISNLGDVVASIDIEEIGQYSLAHLGYAITGFSELLTMVQEVRRRFEENTQA